MKGRDLIRYIGLLIFFSVLNLLTWAAFGGEVDTDRNAVTAAIITLLYAIREPRP